MNSKNDFSTLTNRLNYILKITGTRKADLARAIGVKPQIIQFLCTTQTRSSRFTFELAAALGLNTRWLATGEGEMFIADDAEQIFYKNYKRIPLLSHSVLLRKTLKREPIFTNDIDNWIPLKTEEDNIFSIQIIDTSMAPNIPCDSYVFVQEIKNHIPKENEIYLVFLMQHNTFAVREYKTTNGVPFLYPKNSDLFKEIPFSDKTKIIGIITGCFWTTRSQSC